MTGIYKITNEINGDCYIGSSKDIERRWKQHLYLSQKQGKRSEYHLYRAFRKFGIENFSFAVLELCQEEQLIELEQKYYSIYNPTYNNIQPKENPACNEEIKKKIKQECKKAFARHSEETKEKIYRNLQKGRESEGFNAKKHAPRKIRAIKLSDGSTQEFDSLYQAEMKIGVSRSSICQILSEKHKRKQSKGYTFEYVSKMS